MPSSFLEIPAAPFVIPLCLLAGGALLVLGGFGIWQRHLTRIALRQIPRRKGRTMLILLGLMFATLFTAASLVIDDTITLAVKSVAVFNLGKIDEDVTSRTGGTLHVFPERFGQQVEQELGGDPKVAGVAPALVAQHVFLADQTTRQVRGNVTVFALATGKVNALTDLRGPQNLPASVGALASGEIYLNRNAATLLGASPGDTIWLTAAYWQDQRLTYHVREIVSGGPLGDAPAAVLPLVELQRITGSDGSINHIFVANAGDGLTGVGLSNAVDAAIDRVVLRQLVVRRVKQDGVRFALQAQDIFGRILLLYTLFAVTLGGFLIFLIFVLLAAERRAEIGTLRALGMRQWQVVLALVIEGAIYDLGGALLGILAGLGVSAVILAILRPTLAQIGFPLQTAIDPQTVLVALASGFLFTLVTICLAALAVTRVTVAAAMRDLPEPPRAVPLDAQFQRYTAPLSAALLGIAIGTYGVTKTDALLFSLGLSIGVVGGVGLLRAAAQQSVARSRSRAPIRRWIDRIAWLLIGGSLVGYWSLPFDALAAIGLPRFAGGIQVFFIAGVMMVLGVVIAIAPNLDLLLLPVRGLLMRVKGLRHIVRIALVYPVLHRFRTAVGLGLFSLVVFTMVVMATIAASVTQRYDDLPADAAGYTIAGRALTGDLGGASAIAARLRQAGINGQSVASVSSAASLAVGIIQPGADNARWSLYPTAQIDGAFLDGQGLPLVARAAGFGDDAAVWSAVRGHPGDVVIDSAALTASEAAILGIHRPDFPGPEQFVAPPIVANIAGFSTLDVLAPDALQRRFAPLAPFFQGDQGDPGIFLHLSHLAIGPGMIAPTILWVADPTGALTQVRVIGIVDNARGQRYGMLGSPATFAPITGNQAQSDTFYYFQTPTLVDAHQVARQLGSAFFETSFETTVLQDLLLDANGPRVFISRVLIGLVGLTLLVGMVALIVTGSRAVVERRQQIGMLRALGFTSWHVRLVFLLESALIGVLGTVTGLVFGLILCRNVFAVNFFAQFQSGLLLRIPWSTLAVICSGAIVVALIAAVVPAWQAGRVAPATALRYE